MYSAKELLKISKEKTPLLVNDIMKGVKEHIIKRSEEEANKGSTYYTIYLRRGMRFIESELLVRVLELVKEFEKHGYKVVIEDDGNDYFVEYVITFSWNDMLLDFRGYVVDGKDCVYATGITPNL